MFRVRWIQSALDDLATIWMNADSEVRQAITDATNALDPELQIDPYRQSESRGDEERILHVYPLGVEIEIDLARRTVWVLHVWRFRHRGR
jgi:hypothetical protein